MKEERQKAARAGRQLGLPGRIGKLFPNSPNQNPFAAMVLKSGKKATLDPGWSFRHLILVGISWNISDVLNKSVNSLM